MRDDSIATALPEEVADEVKQQLKNVMAAILELVEVAVEQLFRAVTLSAHGEIRTVV